MKKIILASVALIAVFASCKKEDIRTVYKANPAEVTITVEVFDAYQGANVTSQANITANAGTVAGNTVKFVGDQAHFNAVPAQKVTISASFDGRDGSVTVPIDGTLEGGIATYSATVVIGNAIDPTKPINYDVVPGGYSEPEVVKSGYLAFATHSHDGKNWCINNTEFILEGLTSFESWLGNNEKKSNWKPVDGVVLSDAEKTLSEDKFKGIVAANPFISKTEKDVKYTVSAFSYFNYKVDYMNTVFYYDVVRIYTLKGGATESVRIATIELNCWSTKGAKVEIASPDHASHYVEGHGIDDEHYSHAHGHGGYNAGGGIVVAD